MTGSRTTSLSSAESRAKEDERQEREKEKKERRETIAAAFKVKVDSAKSLVTFTFKEVRNAVKHFKEKPSSCLSGRMCQAADSLHRKWVNLRDLVDAYSEVSSESEADELAQHMEDTFDVYAKLMEEAGLHKV